MSNLGKLPGIYKIKDRQWYIYKGTYELCKNTYLIAVNIRNFNDTLVLTDPDDTLKLSELEVKVKSYYAHQLMNLGLITSTSLSPTSGVYLLCSLGPTIE
jgi:hypothetical protein